MTYLTYSEYTKMQDRNAREEYIRALLKYTQGNVKKSAIMAGIDRSGFYRLMKKFKINVEDYRECNTSTCSEE